MTKFNLELDAFQSTKNSFSYREFLIFGFGALLLSLIFIGSGFVLYFDPPVAASINFSGVIVHPGDPRFALSALILLVAGILVFFVSIGIFAYGNHIKANRGVSKKLAHPKIIHIEQNDSTHPQNNLIQTIIDSNARSNPDFQNTAKYSSQATCTACGSILSPTEQFCRNCGKKIN